MSTDVQHLPPLGIIQVQTMTRQHHLLPDWLVLCDLAVSPISAYPHKTEPRSYEDLIVVVTKAENDSGLSTNRRVNKFGISPIRILLLFYSELSGWGDSSVGEVLVLQA